MKPCHALHLSGILQFGVVTALLVVGGHAMAATIMVNTNADPDVDTATTCSLRQAVLSANLNSAFGNCTAGELLPAVDEIRFDPGFNGVPIVILISGRSEDAGETGDLDITESLTIIGNGEVFPRGFFDTTANTLIDGGREDRVFEVHSGADVLMEQLAVIGGHTLGTGGGISTRTASSLSLRHVAVVGNRSDGNLGGGISALGDLTLENSAVSSNDAAASGTGSAAGGGIFASLNAGAALTIRESAVNSNRALGGPDAINGAFGGGIALSGAGSVHVSDSFITSNEAISPGEARGGGIQSTAATTTIERSAITFNQAISGENRDALGGGLHSAGLLTLSNVTLSKNRVRSEAGSALGGGLFIGASTATLNNVTLTINEVLGDLASNGIGGGLFVSPASGSAEARVSNTIIAENEADAGNDCASTSSSPIISGGYNLLGNNHACDGFMLAAGDQIGSPGAPIDPKLDGDPRNNAIRIMVGERTYVLDNHSLLDDSSAVDAGNPNMVAENSPPLCEALDQRGFVRPADGGAGVGERCDIGAFELNAEAPQDDAPPPNLPEPQEDGGGADVAGGGGGGGALLPLITLLSLLGQCRSRGRDNANT